MDSGSVLQKNVSNVSNGSAILSKLLYQLKCNQEDKLVGVEDDLQVGVANQYSGSCKLD